MKTHINRSSLWVPIAVIVLLALVVIGLMLIAEPGARIPPLIG